MLEKLKNWLIERFSEDDDFLAEPRGKTGTYAAAKSRKQAPNTDKIEPVEQGLIRNKYIREDTGTHETLKILDDSLVDSGEETGIDPYNTGGFDRSKNWSNRFRK